MAAALDHWEVAPHGELVAIGEAMLTVAGHIPMPLGNFPRRMTVVGLSGGRTAIWSAIALREPEMARIEALGVPSFLIVPGIAHRRDAKIWKDRYPDIRVVCAPGAQTKVSEVVPVDTIAADFNDATVAFETLPGTYEREAALLVRREDTLTLIVNDVIANVQHPNGIGAKIMARLFGFGVDGPRMPRIGKRMFVDDAPALAARFRALANDTALKRIIVSHGDPIEADLAGVLREVADSISPNLPR